MLEGGEVVPSRLQMQRPVTAIGRQLACSTSATRSMAPNGVSHVSAASSPGNAQECGVSQ